MILLELAGPPEWPRRGPWGLRTTGIGESLNLPRDATPRAKRMRFGPEQSSPFRVHLRQWGWPRSQMIRRLEHWRQPLTFGLDLGLDFGLGVLDLMLHAVPYMAGSGFYGESHAIGTPTGRRVVMMRMHWCRCSAKPSQYHQHCSYRP